MTLGVCSPQGGTYFRRALIFLIAVLLRGLPVAAQNANVPLTIVDENGVAVPAATAKLVWRGSLTRVPGPENRAIPTLRCQSDHSGRCRFTAPAGVYQLVVNKEGFYAFTLNGVQVGLRFVF